MVCVGKSGSIALNTWFYFGSQVNVEKAQLLLTYLDGIRRRKGRYGKRWPDA